MSFSSLIVITFLFLFLFTPLISHAQDGTDQDQCSVPPDLRAARPDENGPPTNMDIGFFVLDLKDIKDSDQTFEIDLLFDVKWNDPRLSEKALGRSLENCIIGTDKIWFPRIIDMNMKSGEKRLDYVVHVDRKGNVSYLQRIVGIFNNNYIYNDFPFDTQILKIIFANYDYGYLDLQFSINTEKLRTRDEFSIEGWSHIKLMEPEIESTYIEDENRNVSRVVFVLSAVRDKGFYIWKIIVPLCCIVLMAWAVFWIPPTAIGPQIGLSTATVFTLIAYRLSIGIQLPKISYFTRMDKFVFASTILVFFALAAAITTSNLASKGQEERAYKIEKFARNAYLAVFILIIIFSFLI